MRHACPSLARRDFTLMLMDRPGKPSHLSDDAVKELSMKTNRGHLIHDLQAKLLDLLSGLFLKGRGFPQPPQLAIKVQEGPVIGLQLADLGNSLSL